MIQSPILIGKVIRSALFKIPSRRNLHGFLFCYNETPFKGTVQRDGSGRKEAHSIELYKRKRRGGFLDKFARPPSSEIYYSQLLAELAI